ncbi:MAG: OmpA family protein, partial [Bacteroidetes bacterium]|nr:OmpA family protein [Bacteroidota bacterium]
YGFFPVNNGEKAYIARVEKDGLGATDIYEYELSFPGKTAKTEVQGKLVNNTPDYSWNEDITASVTDGETLKKIEEVKVDHNTGGYSVSLPAGSYKISFISGKQKRVTAELNLPKVFYNSEMSLETEIPDEIGLLHRKDNSLAQNNTQTGDRQNADLSSGSSTGELRIKNILFGFDKHTTDAYYSTLDKLADYLKNNTSSKIEVAGYTDLQGNENYNLILSQRRAGFVKDYLVRKGADKSSITTIGHGEKNQVSINDKPLTRKYNRRVEITVLKMGAQKLVIEPMEIPEEYRIK